jgi:BRCA1 C Terminus (BRCT) domain
MDGKKRPHHHEQGSPLATCKKRKVTAQSDGNKKTESSKNVPAASVSAASPTRGSKPWKGKVVAVSTLADTTSKNDSEAVTYKQVALLCEQLGAKITGQVHKKVHCVVASDEAAGLGQNQATQRVRKAWKKGIPVVNVNWVKEYIATKNYSYFQTAHIPPQNQTSPSPKATSSQRSNTIAQSSQSEQKFVDKGLAERHLDLGCCCVCHEHGTKACPWCVDCSVNTKNE